MIKNSVKKKKEQRLKLFVFKSRKHFYIQVFDKENKIIFSISTLTLKLPCNKKSIGILVDKFSSILLKNNYKYFFLSSKIRYLKDSNLEYFANKMRSKGLIF